MCLGDGIASESNFDDIIQILRPNEIHKLFHELGIRQHEIEKAERGANTDDVDLKARAVLRWWKKTNGKKATRDVILEALAKCQDKQTKLNLQEQIVKRGESKDIFCLKKSIAKTKQNKKQDKTKRNKKKTKQK